MADRIYVSYSAPATAGVGLPVYHMTIHYEKNDQFGNVINHQTMDFGPQHPLSTNDRIKAVFQELIDLINPSNTVNQYGLIWGGTNPNAALERPGYPYELIAEGGDFSSNWATMLQFKDAIIFDGYVYKSISQNSNTAGNAALVAGGFSPAKGRILDPEHGVFDWYSVPGLSNKLEAPVGHTPVWMPLNGILYSSVTNSDGTKTHFAEGPAGLAASVHLDLNGAVDQTSITYLEPGVGVLKHFTSYPANGTQIDVAFGPNGDRIETKTDTGNTFDWNREIQTFIDNNPVNKIVIDDNEAVAHAEWNGAAMAAGEIGGALGSSLGKLLGGNSLIGQVAAGTVMGVVGKEVGKALFMGGNFQVETVVKDVFGTLAGGPGIGSLPAAAIGAISSLLMSELADALNLDGFEGGLFTTAGTTITNQLITNAYGMMTRATFIGPNGTPLPYEMFTGFNPEAIITNLGGAIGGYLGTTLAAHVMVPQYEEGAIGQQVGATVGGTVGALLLAPFPVVGPIIGSFLGSFIGGVAGSLLGDLAGNDPESHGRVYFMDHRFWPDPQSFWGDNGADGETFMHIATYTALTLNALADYAGVQMNGLPVDPNASVSNGLQLNYAQNEDDFWVAEQSGSLAALVYDVDDKDDLSPLVTGGIMALVHSVTLTGGDPLVRYAWAHSQAESPSSLAFDLQVAKDYRRYLDDKDMIDAMMAAMPESAFTAGWVLTLLKARELGLDTAGANNDFRAGNDTINATSAHEFLVGGAGHDIINGDGGDDRIRGDAGNDTLRGGVGNDILIGGADVDTAVFAGPRSAYTLTDLGGGVIEVTGPDGTDKLVQMERLQFDDKLVTLPLFRDLAATLSLAGATANIGVRNNGNLATSAFAAAVYLSTDTNVTTADTAVATTSFGALNYDGGMDFRTLALAFPGNLTPGTYYLGTIADTAGQVAETNEANNLSTVVPVTLGNDSDNPLNGGPAADTIFGLGGRDTLNGGGGADLLVGGAGSDWFVFDQTTLANAQSGVIDRIGDYNRSSGISNWQELDKIDLRAILEPVYGVHPIPTLVRAFQAGTGAYLQVDTDGPVNGQNWVTIARLEGVRSTDVMFVRLGWWEGDGGSTLPVMRPTSGDFGADHNSDILWRTDSGALGIWGINGTTIKFADYIGQNGSYVGTPGPDWHVLGTGDFDGDGKSDLLWWTDSGNVAVWTMNDTQVTAADYLRSGTAIIGRPGPDWHVIGARDFDGDSKTDLLWRTDSGALAIWEMDGTQLKTADYIRSGSTQINAPGTDWHVAATADFDGDSKADILWRTDSGALAVWGMNGTQIKFANYLSMSGNTVGVPGADWHIAGTGDFDGDGKSDILWRTDSGALAIWMMDGTAIKSADYTRVGAAQQNAHGPDWHITRVADYDGDGRSDILWRTDGGALAIWEMNGTQIKFANYISQNGAFVPAPGPDWHIVNHEYYVI